MLTYTINPKGSCPMYEQLYLQIRGDIERGVLTAGEKLPSKRSLAQHLRVSVITVENAYGQLVAEGYLQAVEKSGYYVNALERYDSDNTVVMPLVQESPARPEYFCDFRSNSIYAGKFPFSTWSKLLREVLSQQQAQLLEPVPPQGVLELRRAIADYLYRFRGMKVSPNQLIIGAGTEYLYSLIIQLLGRDSVFALENPGYTKLARIYRKNDVTCRFLSMGDNGIDVTDLKKSGADVVHISPSHQFPTGVVMPVGGRRDLLKWAGENEGRFIIEDDYDSEFRFTSRPIPAMQTMDTMGKVIYVNTFTKTLAPSLRIGYMVLPPQLLKVYREELGFYACTVPSFEQYTLARFMEGGHFERHISRMRTTYKTHRDKLISCIRNSSLSAISTINEQHAGLHFLLHVNTERSDPELTVAAAEQEIRIACLSEYMENGNQEKNSHTIVICYSGVELSKMEEAVARLSKAICS